MATTQKAGFISLTAGGTIGAFRCVEASTSADLTCTLANADTDFCLGINQDAVTVGQACTIGMSGILKVQCTASTIAAGALVTVDGAGGGIKTAGSGDCGIGVALVAFAADEIGEILFVPNLTGATIA